VTHIYNLNGDLCATYAYDAWGNCKVDNILNNIGDINPIRYRGYYYDVETGLYYLKSRYYDPETGRFISPDNIENLNLDGVNGLNLFAYCGNNPVMNVDTTGDSWKSFWRGVGDFFNKPVVKKITMAVVVAGLAVGATLVGGPAGAALAGAAIGGLISAVSQEVFTGDISWAQFGLDVGIGAISGLIGASGISRIGATIVGGILGGGSSIASDLIANKPIDVTKAVISLGIGALAGYIGGAGASNKAEIKKAITKSATVLKVQNSVAKVGYKMANGLYVITQGAKSAYTQVMNKMSKAVFSAAANYSQKAIFMALGAYGIGTFVTNFIFEIGW